MPTRALRNLDDLIETINRGIIDVKNMSSEQRRDWMNEYPPVTLGASARLGWGAEDALDMLEHALDPPEAVAGAADDPMNDR
jgi:hypothetical protein